MALEAVEALEALASMLRSTLGLFSMAHGTGALLSSAQDCQAQDPSLRSARSEATLGQVPIGPSPRFEFRRTLLSFSCSDPC